jgi:transmembrane sensor
MDEVLLKNLLDKYLTGELSEQDRSGLSGLLEQPGYQALLEQILAHEFREHRFDEGGQEGVINRIEAHVRARIAPAPKAKMVYLKRWAVAAAIVLLVGAEYYLATRKPDNKLTPEIAASAERIEPGGNKAILTLGDGKRIDVGDASNGELAVQGKTKIRKSDNGRLMYTARDIAGQEVVMNTLTTPRGGIFQVALPDGTQVWLNAGSSIRYPTAFTGKQRQISITGEAYFEVAKDKTKPFEVRVNDMRIEVLGTHFNVNAYDNEDNRKTTLLEGSIELINGPYHSLLKPGQQAQSGKNDKITVLQPEDMLQTIAWKNGFFNFTNADLPTILRQLERWYDIEVRFEGPVPQRRFQGELPRNLRLDEILKVLKGVNIKYEMQGKTLIIES